MSEQHFFDIGIAKKYGVNEAIIYTNLLFWVKKNKANGTHYYDGRYWSYNSVKAFQKLFPYLTGKQIRTALENLVNNNVIIKGNYNNNHYDRTLWYAFKEEPEELKLMEGQIDNNIKANGFDKKETSILPEGQIEKPKTENHYTDINTDVNPNLNPDGNIGNTPSDFDNSVYDATTGLYIEKEYDRFLMSFIGVFTELTAKTATQLLQVDGFKTPEKQKELQTLFENRRYDWEGCIAYAKKECQKAEITKRWLEFMNIIRLVLRDGADGIKKHISLEEQKRLEQLKQIEEQKRLEEERLEAEQQALEIENIGRQKAKELGISYEEYKAQQEAEFAEFAKENNFERYYE